jgi:hypothetical protein
VPYCESVVLSANSGGAMASRSSGLAVGFVRVLGRGTSVDGGVYMGMLGVDEG